MPNPTTVFTCSHPNLQHCTSSFKGKACVSQNCPHDALIGSAKTENRAKSCLTLVLQTIG